MYYLSGTYLAGDEGEGEKECEFEGSHYVFTRFL